MRLAIAGCIVALLASGCGATAGQKRAAAGRTLAGATILAGGSIVAARAASDAHDRVEWLRQFDDPSTVEDSLAEAREVRDSWRSIAVVLGGGALLGAVGSAYLYVDSRSAPPDAAPPRPSRRGYVWQLIATDVACLGVAGVAVMYSAGSDSTPGFGVAAVAFGAIAVVPPIIHLAHGQRGRAGMSLLLRAGLPLLAHRFGEIPEDGRGFDTHAETEALALGLVGAMVLDYVFLGGRTRVSAAPIATPSGPVTGLVVVGGF